MMDTMLREREELAEQLKGLQLENSLLNNKRNMLHALLQIRDWRSEFHKLLTWVRILQRLLCGKAACSTVHKVATFPSAN